MSARASYGPRPVRRDAPPLESSLPSVMRRYRLVSSRVFVVGAKGIIFSAREQPGTSAGRAMPRGVRQRSVSGAQIRRSFAWPRRWTMSTKV